MKRIGNIYEKICTFENCKEAIIKASKNKKYRNDVRNIITNIDKYAFELSKMLKNKEYKPSKYIEKKIYDGANKKERTIYKPKFYPDQCVHWALMLQIKSMITRGMYNYSCAAIEGRGIIYRSKIRKENTCKRQEKYKVLFEIRYKKILSIY